MGQRTFDEIDRLEKARIAGDEGMERAAAKAERIEPDWKATAYAEIRAGIGRVPEPFTWDQVLSCLGVTVPDGADGRAWGAVTRWAIRDGVIMKTGQFAPSATSNCAAKPLYVRGTP